MPNALLQASSGCCSFSLYLQTVSCATVSELIVSIIWFAWSLPKAPNHRWRLENWSGESKVSLSTSLPTSLLSPHWPTILLSFVNKLLRYFSSLAYSQRKQSTIFHWRTTTSNVGVLIFIQMLHIQMHITPVHAEGMVKWSQQQKTETQFWGQSHCILQFLRVNITNRTGEEWRQERQLYLWLPRWLEQPWYPIFLHSNWTLNGALWQAVSKPRKQMHYE